MSDCDNIGLSKSVLKWLDVQWVPRVVGQQDSLNVLARVWGTSVDCQFSPEGISAILREYSLRPTPTPFQGLKRMWKDQD